jgi:hypothetical protein
MNNFNFWQKWLFGVAFVIVIFGLALAFFNDTTLFAFFDQNINPVFWQGQIPPQAFITFKQWNYAVLGATMAGWGVCIAFMTVYPFRKRERWVWNALVSAVLLWFVVDTFFSVRFGVIFNALFNVLVLIAVALPLLFTRRYFRDGQS